MPVDIGSTTLSTAAAATAASIALPPESIIRRPADAASGWLVATMPLVAHTTERREVNSVVMVWLIDSFCMGGLPVFLLHFLV